MRHHSGAKRLSLRKSPCRVGCVGILSSFVVPLHRCVTPSYGSALHLANELTLAVAVCIRIGGSSTREALFQLGVLLCLTGMRAPLTDMMVPEAVMFPW